MGDHGAATGALQQIISPQELAERFGTVMSALRGERARTELGPHQEVATRESSYWPDFKALVTIPNAKLEPESYKDFLLKSGQTLQKNGELTCASELFYATYLTRFPAEDGRRTMQTRADLLRFAGVVYGKAECDRTLLRVADVDVAYAGTFRGYVEVLRAVRDAVDLLLVASRPYKGADSLYWLVHDGVVLMGRILDPLVPMGFGKELVEFYVWGILSVEVFIELSTVRYLPFRTALYARCANAYESYQHHAAAARVAARGLQAIDRLQAEEEMDPPVPEGTLRVLSRSRQDMLFLVVKYRLRATVTEEAMAAGPFMPVDQILTVALEALQPLAPATDEDEGGEPAVPEEVLVGALVEAGSHATARVLKPDGTQSLTDRYVRTGVTKAIAASVGPALAEAMQRGSYDSCLPVPLHVGYARLAYGTGQTWEEAAVAIKSLLARLQPPTPPPDYDDIEDTVVDVPVPSQETLDWLAEFELLDALLELEHADACLGASAPPAEELPVEEPSVEGVPTPVSTSPPPPSFRIAGREFPVAKLEAFASTLLNIVTDGRLAVLEKRPDLVADAALGLWSPYCDAMLHAVDDALVEEPLDPRLIDVLINVLTTVHVAADRANVDDALLRGRVALRLVLLLEKEGELRDAIQLSRHAAALVDRSRASRMDARKVQPQDQADVDAVSMASVTLTVDERAQVAAKARPGGHVYGLGSSLEPLDQDLAVLHTDLQLAVFRCELALGSLSFQATQKHRARAKRLKERELARNRAAGGAYQPPARDPPPMKTSQEDDILSSDEDPEDVEDSEPYLPAAPSVEARLHGECKKNFFFKAMLQLCIASRFRPSKDSRESVVYDACALLEKAEAEATMLAADARFLAENDGSWDVANDIRATLVPSAPRFVSRSSTSATIRLTPYRQMPSAKRRKARHIDHFRVFGKLTGAGTAVSLNNTDYDGTGVAIPAVQLFGEAGEVNPAKCVYGTAPNTVITIMGLVPNESYVFACAAYDSNGDVVEGIGATSEVPITCSLPLPTLLCWSYIGKVAVTKGLPELSKRACDLVYAQFVDLKATQGLTIWEANPLNAHSLRLDFCERTSKPILQSFCRAVYAFVDSLSVEVGSGGPVPPKAVGDVPKLTKSFIPQQVETMRILQRILIAIEVACMTATVDDGSGVGSSRGAPTCGSDLVMEGVNRAYNFMLPLLRLKKAGHFLVRACTTLCHALSIVPKNQWYPACQRVYARVTYEMKRFADELEEPTVRSVVLEAPQHTAGNHSPVAEQIALVEAFNSQREVWTQGKDTSAALAGMRRLGQDQQEDEDLTPIDEAVWNTVHGDSDSGGGEDDVAKKARITNAFVLLKETYSSDPRFLEFVCRICKLGLQNDMTDLVNDWLNGEESGLVEFVGNEGFVNPTDIDPEDLPGTDEEAEANDKSPRDRIRPSVPPLFGAIPTRVIEEEVSGIPDTARIFNDTLVKLTEEMKEIQAQERARRIANGAVMKDSREVADEDEEGTKGEKTEEGMSPNPPRISPVEDDPDASRTDLTADEERNMLWLAEIELLRAQCIVQRMSTEGAYERAPPGDGPLTDLTPGLVDDDLEEGTANGDDVATPIVPPLGLQMGQPIGTGPEYQQKLHQRGVTRKLMRKCFRHCAKAAGRARRAKKWALLRTVSKLCWNAIWLGWVSPTEFGDNEARQAAMDEIIVLREEIRTARKELESARTGQSGSRPNTSGQSARPGTGESGGTASPDRPVTGSNSRPGTRGSEMSNVSFNLPEGEGMAKKPIPLEFDWRPLWRVSSSLLDMHDELRREYGEDNVQEYLAVAGETAFVSRLVIYTIQVLTNCNMRRESIALGERLLEMSGKESSSSEQVLPIILHGQRQIWRKFDVALKVAEAKLEVHEENWARQVAEKAKRRKRRLVQVGKSAEEKAYLQVKAVLESSVQEKRTLERTEFTHMDILQRSWDELKRDKNNSQELYDSCLKQLRSMISLSEGEFNDGLGGDGHNDGNSVRSGGGSTHRSRKSHQSTSRTKGHGSTVGGSSTARSGRSSKRNSVDPGEPHWIKTILKAFSSTANVLRSKQETMLLAMLMDTLGDFHCGRQNMKRRVDAGKAWSDVVDTLVGTVDVAETWRDIVVEEKTLKQANGFWGLILAGIAMSKIAEYTCIHDLRRQNDSCQFAAYLFRACLKGSLPHPTRSADFLRSSGGIVELWPGVELMGHKYSPNPTHLLQSLRFSTHVMLRDRNGLEALPMICLSEYVASKITRNVAYLVQARLNRVDALLLAGCPAEAIRALAGLLKGEDLCADTDQGPTIYTGGPSETGGLNNAHTGRSSASGKSAPKTESPPEEVDDYVLAIDLVPFANSASPDDEANAPALAWLADFESVRLTGRLKTLYGTRLCHELTLIRARVLVYLGQYDAARALVVALEEAARSGKACGTEPKPREEVAEEGKTGRSTNTAASEVEAVEPKPEMPRRLIQVEIYLICYCLLIQSQIEEAKRNFGEAIKFAEQAATFHADETARQAAAKQRSMMLEAQRARHAKQALGMSPRPAQTTLGGIAEESPDDLLDDLLNADFRNNEEDDPLLRPGMSFWLSCRTIVGRCRLAKGHLEEARQTCDKGIEEASLAMESLNRRKLMVMRAQIHMSEGEVQDAKKLYETVLEKGREYGELDEDHAEAAMLLADLLQELSLAEPSEVASKYKNESERLYEEALSVLTLKLRAVGWLGSTADKASILHNIYADRWLGGYTKALLRAGRTKSEQEVATSAEGEPPRNLIVEGLQCIEEGLRSLEHQHAPNISLKPTLSLFQGRFQRLLLPLSVAIGTAFPMAVSALERCLESALTAGHNHATLRAANMELVELYGRQWIAGEEEAHKNKASRHLQLAAQVAGMYAKLKGEVGTLCKATPYSPAEMEALPHAVRVHLEQEGIRRALEQFEAERGVSEDQPEVAAGEVDEYAEARAAVMEAPVSIDERSVFLYYMSLVLTRRLADASAVSDAKARTIVELHDFLKNNMSAYQENCCLPDDAFFPPPVAEDGDETTSQDANLPSYSVVAQWYVVPKEDGENVASLYSLLGGIPVEGDAEVTNLTKNAGDLGRCILPVDFIRKTSKTFAALRIKKAQSMEIDSVLNETTIVLAEAATAAGMRSGPVNLDTDRQVLENIDEEALVILEKMFDLEIGVNCVNEGVSRWLRNALLGH